MSCERCGGLMVIETFCDLREEESRTGIDTTRCLNCGNFEDTIIRTNRVISHLPRHVAPHTVGSRRLSATQPRSLEGAIQTEGSLECPRGRGPQTSVAAPSAKKNAANLTHRTTHSLFQTRGTYEYPQSSLQGNVLAGGKEVRLKEFVCECWH
jgi:hypothetical protein